MVPLGLQIHREIAPIYCLYLFIIKIYEYIYIRLIIYEMMLSNCYDDERVNAPIRGILKVGDKAVRNIFVVRYQVHRFLFYTMTRYE